MNRTSDTRHCGRIFWMLLILNLVSNSLVLWQYPSLFGVLCVVCLSGLFATAETLAVHLLGRVWKPLGTAALWIMTALYTLLTATDIFMITTFGQVIFYHTAELIMNTRADEGATFGKSYFGPLTIALYAGGAAAYIYAAWMLARLADAHIGARWGRRIAIGTSVAGTAIYLYMGVAAVCSAGTNGGYIPAYTTLTRVLNSLRHSTQTLRFTRELTAACREAEATAVTTPETDFVFILGESFACHHTPLYGYDRPTTPNLSAWSADSSLVVFTDVISPSDNTLNAMKYMLNMSVVDRGTSSTPIFPVLFRRAGYYTALYENQFTTGDGDYFQSAPELSGICYDFRSDRYLADDSIVAAAIRPVGRPGFYFIHLYGQHYYYRDRYPASFARFTPDGYDSRRFTPTQRADLAAYDNATLYNDHIVASIIGKWRDRDAVVVYISDHGEEIHDLSDFFGHGTAKGASDPSFQLRVPMMVYMTPTFLHRHPEKALAIRRAAPLRATTDDIGHMLMELADISTPSFDPARSVVNPAYDPTRPRLIRISYEPHPQVYD